MLGDSVTTRRFVELTDFNFTHLKALIAEPSTAVIAVSNTVSAR
jgi:hypothetical protein